MDKKLTVHIVGDFKSGAADGLAEFNYQNVKLLEEAFIFEFIEFDRTMESTWYHIEIRDGITVHRFGVKDLSVLKLAVAFTGWLSGLPAEGRIFHLSHIWNIPNYLIARKLVKAGIPYLITPHDSYVYGQVYNKNRPLLKRLYRKVFVRIFDKYVLDHAEAVHALTQHCVASLQVLTNTPIIVVENQIKDWHVPFSVAEIKPQVCFIGRFSIFQKGIDLALDAFSKFKRNVQGGAVRFILIGPADNEALETAISICEELKLNIDEDVVFTGKVPEAERNSILGQSKVYMQLSRYEGFGLSVGQALSCYKPVIVSADIPISTTIERYRAGFIVNSVQEAADALDNIFSMSADRYLDMAMNARRCYEQEFHPDVIKPKLTALYESVAEDLKERSIIPDNIA